MYEIKIFIILIGIFIFEYIGDFIFQSREVAVTKSNNILILLSHLMDIGNVLAFYFFSLLVLKIYSFSIVNIFLFILIYLCFHGIQDWFIWKYFKFIKMKQLTNEVNDRILEIGLNRENTFKNMLKERINTYYNKKEYADDKLFYNIIGLDRILHIITLTILFYFFLIK